MDYQIPTDIYQRIREFVARGDYENEDAVLRGAIDALDWRREHEELLRRWNERNRRATDESRRGLSKPLDDDAVLGRLRERLAREGIGD